MQAHLIKQDCRNDCGMKVETVLREGDTVPSPRVCVRCKNK